MFKIEYTFLYDCINFFSKSKNSLKFFSTKSAICLLLKFNREYQPLF